MLLSQCLNYMLSVRFHENKQISCYMCVSPSLMKVHVNIVRGMTIVFGLLLLR